MGEMVALPLKLRHRRRLNPLGEGRHGFNREVVVAESGPAPPWRPAFRPSATAAASRSGIAAAS